MPYVQRTDGNISGQTRWPHPDFPEEIDERDPEYLAFVNKPPPGPPSAPPPANGNSVAALRAEVNAIRQAIIDAGLFKE
jgi:hypothetical protein